MRNPGTVLLSIWALLGSSSMAVLSRWFRTYSLHTPCSLTSLIATRLASFVGQQVYLNFRPYGLAWALVAAAHFLPSPRKPAAANASSLGGL